MDYAYHHWLRRMWKAYQRGPRGTPPMGRKPRPSGDTPAAAGRTIESGKRDDFEETAPLVFPLH